MSALKKMNQSVHLINFEINLEKYKSEDSNGKSKFKLTTEKRTTVRYPLDLKIQIVGDENTSSLVAYFNSLNISTGGLFIKEKFPDELIGQQIKFIISYIQSSGQKIKFRSSGKVSSDRQRIIFNQESEAKIIKFIDYIFKET